MEVLSYPWSIISCINFFQNAQKLLVTHYVNTQKNLNHDKDDHS